MQVQSRRCTGAQVQMVCSGRGCRASADAGAEVRRSRGGADTHGVELVQGWFRTGRKQVQKCRGAEQVLLQVQRLKMRC